jgi:putative transposase
LVHREKIWVNEKRVRRVMKGNGLMATQTVHKAKRTPQRSKPRAERPRQYWGIDMTKFLIPVLGWVYLEIVLDWYTKRIVGWDLSLRSRASDWKRALEMAIQGEFPQGVRGRGLKLISDNGSQPTSVSFMRDMATLGIEQIFTSYDNPKGNAETERMLRTIKEEIIWLNEFSSLEEAKQRIGQWIEIDYNKFYVHSELGYISPEEFEELYLRQISLKEVA